MSLPRELLDQLLTGYLDDALSADERARVEQLLQTDDQIVNELAQLREIRDSLKAISLSDASIRLDDGFADRVLGAAVARAHAEGLNEDHPLVRLAEQPSTASAAGRKQMSSSWGYAGLLVGLAASIVIAVLTLRPEPSEFAQNAEKLATESLAISEVPGTEPFEDVIDPVPAVVSEASPELASEQVATVDPGIEKVEPKQTEPDPMMESPKASVESIADATKIEISSANTVPSGILILNVQLTEAGRDSGAIGNAMELAMLEPATEKKLTGQMATFVDKTFDRSEQDDTTVLYLQAPAKKLDQFYIRLLLDQEGVQSVGLTISFDAPIVATAEAVRPDPTLVRHDNTALELLRNEQVDRLAHELGGMQYAPLSRDALPPIAPLNPQTPGEDVSAQILILVR
ncbi:MAG: anti-sigma factor [Rubripirellula sp.]